nr:hypothetical protein HK105_006879 [Polyrhizophydium stewartii]
MNVISRAANNEYAVWLSRIAMIVVAGVFVDNVVRLVRIESETHRNFSALNYPQGTLEYDFAKLQGKHQRFYAQRNVYLSGFALFMTLVLFRRFRDMYAIAELELEIANLKATPIPGTGAAKAASSSSTTTTTTTTTSSSKPIPAASNGAFSASPAADSTLRNRKDK